MVLVRLDQLSDSACAGRGLVAVQLGKLFKVEPVALEHDRVNGGQEGGLEVNGDEVVAHDLADGVEDQLTLAEGDGEGLLSGRSICCWDGQEIEGD